jgi:hypothetical protein
MQIQYREQGQASVVSLPAQLVMAVAPTIRTALAQLVDNGRESGYRAGHVVSFCP